jgi:quercetin dioxygenase-like cupin family protein
VTQQPAVTQLRLGDTLQATSSGRKPGPLRPLGATMQKLSLDALARELLGRAAAGEKPGDSRESRTVVGGHEKALRQTVIALAKGAALAEHVSPGEATLIVLRGRVTLTAGTESWEGREGDLLILPDAPHSLTALADSAVLLTVAKLPLPAQRARSRRALVACCSHN